DRGAPVSASTVAISKRSMQKSRTRTMSLGHAELGAAAECASRGISPANRKASPKASGTIAAERGTGALFHELARGGKRGARGALARCEPQKAPYAAESGPVNPRAAHCA